MASVIGSTTINGRPAYLMSDGSKVIQQNSTPANANRSTVYGTQSSQRALPAANLENGSLLGLQTGPSGPANNGSGNAGGGQPAAPSFDDIINESFNATMGFLDSQANTLRGQLPGIEADINAQYGQSRNTLDVDRQQGERQLATAQQGGEQRQEDAVTAATRLFNELKMGGNQRFGGSSSAGEAYETLANRELMRNRQQIATDFSTFMGQVEGARQTIMEKYTLALQGLETQKNQMLSEARRDLQNKLMQIEGQKAMAQEEKANRKLQALQDMRNQVFQIQLAQAEGKSNIDTIRQNLESQLQQYTQQQTQSLTQAEQGGEQFAQGLDYSPETSLAMGGAQAGRYQTPTGSINRDEELTGSIFQPRRQLDSMFG